MKKELTIIFFVLILIPSLFAQNECVVKIDSIFTNLTNADLFSGAVLIADSSGVLLS